MLLFKLTTCITICRIAKRYNGPYTSYALKTSNIVRLRDGINTTRPVRSTNRFFT